MFDLFVLLSYIGRHFHFRCLCETIDESVSKVIKEMEENPQPSTAVDEDNKSKEKENNKKKKKKRALTPLVYNTFSLLSYIVCQPGGKAAFLSLITTTTECISEFSSFVPNVIAIQSKETDWFFLENCLLPLIQSICDHEVCLTNFNETITRQHLSNQLPTGEFVSAIVDFCFQLLVDEKLPLPLLMRCLNTLEPLTEHDYGMQHIKKFLTEKGKLFSDYILVKLDLKKLCMLANSLICLLVSIFPLETTTIMKI